MPQPPNTNGLVAEVVKAWIGEALHHFALTRHNRQKGILTVGYLMSGLVIKELFIGHATLVVMKVKTDDLGRDVYRFTIFRTYRYFPTI